MMSGHQRGDMPITGPSNSTKPASFQRSIGPVQFLLFGFGSIVGTAWVVLLGGWLKLAGPGGAMVGIIVGGGAMALIAAMYAELGSRFPQTGGEVTYINAAFGKKLAFVVGWLLTLAYVTNLVFEGVALAWLLEHIWPPITGPVLYEVLGQTIGLGSLLASLASCLTIAYLNYQGAKSFVRFQNTLTTLFLLVVAFVVGIELIFGSSQNIEPVWQAENGGFWLVGTISVLGNAPFLFASFQSVLQAIEERSEATSKEFVVRVCVVAVLCAALFYLLVILGAAKAAPRADLAASDLPAVEVLAHLPGAGVLRLVLLLALAGSVLKTWSSVFMTSVRLLFAQSRDGMIPDYFGSVSARTGAPDKAVIAVGIFNFVGLFFGKGIIEPIVNTTSLCIAVMYALVCAATLVMRHRDPSHSGFRVPGGMPVAVLAIVLAIGMAGFALFQPTQSEQATAFKWGLLVSWAGLGLGLYWVRNRGNHRSPP